MPDVFKAQRKGALGTNGLILQVKIPKCLFFGNISGALENQTQEEPNSLSKNPLLENFQHDYDTNQHMRKKNQPNKTLTQYKQTRKKPQQQLTLNQTRKINPLLQEFQANVDNRENEEKLNLRREFIAKPKTETEFLLKNSDNEHGKVSETLDLGTTRDNIYDVTETREDLSNSELFRKNSSTKTSVGNDFYNNFSTLRKKTENTDATTEELRSIVESLRNISKTDSKTIKETQPKNNEENQFSSNYNDIFNLFKIINPVDIKRAISPIKSSRRSKEIKNKSISGEQDAEISPTEYDLVKPTTAETYTLTEQNKPKSYKPTEGLTSNIHTPTRILATKTFIPENYKERETTTPTTKVGYRLTARTNAFTFQSLATKELTLNTGITTPKQTVTAYQIFENSPTKSQKPRPNTVSQYEYNTKNLSTDKVHHHNVDETKDVLPTTESTDRLADNESMYNYNSQSYKNKNIGDDNKNNQNDGSYGDDSELYYNRKQYKQNGEENLYGDDSEVFNATNILKATNTTKILNVQQNSVEMDNTTDVVIYMDADNTTINDTDYSQLADYLSQINGTKRKQIDLGYSYKTSISNENENTKIDLLPTEQVTQNLLAKTERLYDFFPINRTNTSSIHIKSNKSNNNLTISPYSSENFTFKHHRKATTKSPHTPLRNNFNYTTVRHGPLSEKYQNDSTRFKNQNNTIMRNHPENKSNRNVSGSKLYHRYQEKLRLHKKKRDKHNHSKYRQYEHVHSNISTRNHAHAFTENIKVRSHTNNHKFSVVDSLKDFLNFQDQIKYLPLLQEKSLNYVIPNDSEKDDDELLNPLRTVKPLKVKENVQNSTVNVTSSNRRLSRNVTFNRNEGNFNLSVLDNSILLNIGKNKGSYSYSRGSGMTQTYDHRGSPNETMTKAHKRRNHLRKSTKQKHTTSTLTSTHFDKSRVANETKAPQIIHYTNFSGSRHPTEDSIILRNKSNPASSQTTTNMYISNNTIDYTESFKDKHRVHKLYDQYKTTYYNQARQTNSSSTKGIKNTMTDVISINHVVHSNRMENNELNERQTKQNFTQTSHRRQDTGDNATNYTARHNNSDRKDIHPMPVIFIVNKEQNTHEINQIRNSNTNLKQELNQQFVKNETSATISQIQKIKAATLGQKQRDKTPETAPLLTDDKLLKTSKQVYKTVDQNKLHHSDFGVIRNHDSKPNDIAPNNLRHSKPQKIYTLASTLGRADYKTTKDTDANYINADPYNTNFSKNTTNLTKTQQQKHYGPLTTTDKFNEREHLKTDYRSGDLGIKSVIKHQNFFDNINAKTNSTIDIANKKTKTADSSKNNSIPNPLSLERKGTPGKINQTKLDSSEDFLPVSRQNKIDDETAEYNKIPTTSTFNPITVNRIKQTPAAIETDEGSTDEQNFESRSGSPLPATITDDVSNLTSLGPAKQFDPDSRVIRNDNRINKNTIFPIASEYHTASLTKSRFRNDTTSQQKAYKESDELTNFDSTKAGTKLIRYGDIEPPALYDRDKNKVNYRQDVYHKTTESLASNNATVAPIKLQRNTVNVQKHKQVLHNSRLHNIDHTTNNKQPFEHLTVHSNLADKAMPIKTVLIISNKSLETKTKKLDKNSNTMTDLGSHKFTLTDKIQSKHSHGVFFSATPVKQLQQTAKSYSGTQSQPVMKVDSTRQTKEQAIAIKRAKPKVLDSKNRNIDTDKQSLQILPSRQSHQTYDKPTATTNKQMKLVFVDPTKIANLLYPISKTTSTSNKNLDLKKSDRTDSGKNKKHNKNQLRQPAKSEQISISNLNISDNTIAMTDLLYHRSKDNQTNLKQTLKSAPIIQTNKIDYTTKTHLSYGNNKTKITKLKLHNTNTSTYRHNHVTGGYALPKNNEAKLAKIKHYKQKLHQKNQALLLNLHGNGQQKINRKSKIPVIFMKDVDPDLISNLNISPTSQETLGQTKSSAPIIVLTHENTPTAPPVHSDDIDFPENKALTDEEIESEKVADTNVKSKEEQNISLLKNIVINLPENYAIEAKANQNQTTENLSDLTERTVTSMKETSKTQNTAHRQTQQTTTNSSNYHNSTDGHTPMIILTHNNTMFDTRTRYNANVEENADSNGISPSNNNAVKNNEMDKPITYDVPIIFPNNLTLENSDKKQNNKSPNTLQDKPQKNAVVFVSSNSAVGMDEKPHIENKIDKENSPVVFMPQQQPSTMTMFDKPNEVIISSEEDKENFGHEKKFDSLIEYPKPSEPMNTNRSRIGANLNENKQTPSIFLPEKDKKLTNISEKLDDDALKQKDGSENLTDISKMDVPIIHISSINPTIAMDSDTKENDKKHPSIKEDPKVPDETTPIIHVQEPTEVGTTTPTTQEHNFNRNTPVIFLKDPPIAIIDPGEQGIFSYFS